jgi:acyl carrier protein
MNSALSAQHIENWIIDHLGRILGKAPSALDRSTPIVDFGVDSATAIGLTGALSDWLDYELDPTLLYEYPTIAELAAFVASSCNQEAV